jgi:hypothetical protein
MVIVRGVRSQESGVRSQESGVQESGVRRKKEEGRRIVYYQLPITNYQLHVP